MYYVWYNGGSNLQNYVRNLYDAYQASQKLKDDPSLKEALQQQVLAEINQNNSADSGQSSGNSWGDVFGKIIGAFSTVVNKVVSSIGNLFSGSLTKGRNSNTTANISGALQQNNQSSPPQSTAPSKPNPFQAFVDLYPADGSFVGCLHSQMGDTFSAAYSEGVVSSSLESSVQSCMDAVGAAALPPQVQQCSQDTFGFNWHEELANPSFNPTQAENAQFGNCTGVSEYETAKENLIAYLNNQEANAANSNPNSLATTGTFTQTTKEANLVVQVIQSAGIIKSQNGTGPMTSSSLSLDLFGPATVKITRNITAQNCFLSIVGENAVPISGTRTDTVQLAPDSFVQVSANCKDADGWALDYTISSYAKGDYGKYPVEDGMIFPGKTTSNGSVKMTPIKLTQ